MSTNLDEIMNLDELVDYLKISKSTLYKLLRRGQLPGKKVGKQWRFHREMIVAWLTNHSGRIAHGDWFK